MTIAAPFDPLGLPMLALRLEAETVVGRLELRGITDDLLADLVELARAGVHEAGVMPFCVPWTEVEPSRFGLSFAQYHWGTRAKWSPDAWDLNLAVVHEGTLVGCQGFGTTDYLVTRTGETGSWLGLAHQGRGLGTEMRRVICAFLFDHLGAHWVTSGHFNDNPASGAVSRKVGYRANGVEHRQRREGELATLQHLILAPDDFDRGEVRLEVHGLADFRRSIGLPAS